jgi:hypothetical protein
MLRRFVKNLLLRWKLALGLAQRGRTVRPMSWRTLLWRKLWK